MALPLLIVTDMFQPIDTPALVRVTGGTKCPLYKSNQGELDKRQRASKGGRKRMDDAWAKTWAGLSDERKAAVRQQALDNGAADPCRATVEPGTLAVEQLKMLGRE